MKVQSLTVQANGSDHLSTVVFLEDANYRLDFYTTRVPNLMTGEVVECWYLDLYDSAGDPLVMGIGLTAGTDILYPYRALGVPPGKLFVWPQTAAFIDPAVGAFEDDDAVLYYQPSDSVEELGLAS